MFRECYFEYAGVSSQSYNLVLCYLSNSNEDFDSGGGFELKTDTLPLFHETLLYGKDYSAKPLSFEIEIINPDDYIPLEQMIEIKNWLYEQDGWKSLVLKDPRQDYRLKCILEPGEDIVDGTGYRGVRCTVHNASPFWYGEDVTVTFKHDDLKATVVDAHPYWYSSSQYKETRPFGIIQLDITDERMVGVEYYPTLHILDERGAYRTGAGGVTETYTDDTEFVCCISNCAATTVNEGKALDGVGFDMPDTSRIAFSTEYIGSTISSLTGSNYDYIDVSTRYGYVQSQRYPSHAVKYCKPNLAYLKLHKGTNILRVLEPTLYNSISITYTPLYRLGAF